MASVIDFVTIFGQIGAPKSLGLGDSFYPRLKPGAINRAHLRRAVLLVSAIVYTGYISKECTG